MKSPLTFYLVPFRWIRRWWIERLEFKRETRFLVYNIQSLRAQAAVLEKTLKLVAKDVVAQQHQAHLRLKVLDANHNVLCETLNKQAEAIEKLGGLSAEGKQVLSFFNRSGDIPSTPR